MKKKLTRSLPLILSVFSLFSCQATNNKQEVVKQESRWYNVNAFVGIDSIGTNFYDLTFESQYSSVDGNTLNVHNCIEVTSIGDNEILEREFARWDLLKIDCEAAKRFYDAPEYALNYWPLEFDLPLLKTFPSTSIPYLGGQALDGRRGDLGSYESNLKLIESGKDNIKVSFGETVVNYVILARGDFNRDGYQDIFIRMDWYIEGAFGDGSDWIVVTKITPDTSPILLWRK